MDIVIAHNFYQQAGGEDQCVAAEANLLRANGHTVIPYTAYNDQIRHMGTAQVGLRAVWSGTAFGELRQLFRARRPHLVHFHNTFPLISPSGYYAARMEGVPVVQTLHNFRLICGNAVLYRNGAVCEACVGRRVAWPGVIHGCYHNSRSATAAVAATTAVHHLIGTWLRMVDVYIALTEFGCQKLIAGGLPKDRIAIKPNFVFPDPGLGRQGGRYVAFIGRLSPEKGVTTLLQAWQHLGGAIKLKIAGDGPMAPMVRSAAKRDPAIEWLGNMTQDAVCRLIADASIVVVPSHCYESFSRVIVESFAAGTPVIASGFGAMAQLVRDGDTGVFFRPGDAADLANKIQSLFADPQAAARMRGAGRAEFEKHYTADANYRTLMAIYDMALLRQRQRSCALVHA
jgi:glycosyltransferase involved in cell wall biosynthesis